MQKQRAIGGSTSTGFLKILALIFMFADHSGKMLLPGVPEMRMLGRIAFPLYCWCLVVGFHYTRSVPKYMLRLLVIGLVSQPLYMAALNHGWTEPNIFLTLLLGLAAMWGMREKWFGSHIWAPVIALLLAVQLKCDYGWRGVMLILLLYAAQESKASIAAVMIAFCLYWGSNSTIVRSVFGISLNPILVQPIAELIRPWLQLQGLAILALPLMLIPLPKMKMPSWLGYALYPLHLVVLLILERVF
ncbi:MAG: hypothetical protein J1E43_02680 [Christensenellaceae bacterium]|nr:hypothetical protein [Christensenellaceae bacterium]